ncbi:MAG: hypothetical protein Q8J78_02265 [Moraxellaceae bacterium]|nr:hypothetical protein [Moraxellaceae bacterium]
MRRTLIGLALGLVLPLGIAHADVASDLKAGQPMQTVLTNALKNNVSIEAALREVLKASPDQAYAAISAALQLSPDQAANIVSAALSREYNLNAPQVVVAALQGAPEKAGVIVPTAIVKSASFYTVPIVQRALADGVDGSKFVPQAMRTSPRQSATILSQALRSASQQTRAIMEAVIADQPDKAVEYVKIALDAKAPAGDVLAAAFKVAPRQADAIAAAASEKGVPTQTIAAAAGAAGLQVAGYNAPGANSGTSQARPSGMTLQPNGLSGSGSGGGGGGGSPASPS